MLNLLGQEPQECGFKIGEGLLLNHLQFADDTLILCDANSYKLSHINDTLEIFLWASGLKVNYSKSQLIGCNVEEEKVRELAALVDVSVGTLPFNYLGVPLGGNPRRKQPWVPLVEKMRTRTAPWRSKFLSLSGRLVLLKDVISAIPVYYLSIFKAPVGVIGQFEKLMRSYLWGSSEGRRKVCWVAWEQICKDQQMGGLGLGFLGWKNKALLLKWAWRFGREQNALWRKVVCLKYGWNDKCLLLHLVAERFSCCSIVWQDILKTLSEDSLIAKEFRNQLYCKVGQGNQVRFWLDPWVTTLPLHQTFPRMFALAVGKDASVCEMGSRVGRAWSWRIELRRSCVGWEVDEEISFYATINSFISCSGDDNIIWLGDQRGLYLVKGLCSLLEQKTLNQESISILNRVRKVIPPKVAVFLWQATLNKIAVKENLVKRGLIIENKGRCCLCGLVAEPTMHLMLHCSLTWQLWCGVVNREDQMWCCPENLQNLMLEWPGLCGKSDAQLWELIPYAMIWSIWLARNDQVFNNKAFPADLVWDLHVSRIVWWVKAKWKDCPYSVNDFMQNFGEVRFKAVKVRNRQNEWTPPPEGVLKFNVDGSAIGAPERSGVGGILKNARRQILGVFSKAMGELWAYEAEVKAILQALIFCKQHQLQHILIESDSTLAVGWISKQENRPWKLIQDLNLIDALCLEVDSIGIKHIYRESNPLADYLAKSGCWREHEIWSFNDQIVSG